MRITAGKRVFVAMVAASALAIGLGGCSSSSPSNTSSLKGKTLTIMETWNDPISRKTAQDLFAAFTKATGVTVKSQPQSGNGSTYQPAVRTAMSSSTSPTIASDIAGPEVFAMAKAGVLMDVTSTYNDVVKSRALGDSAINGITYNGKIYGISAGPAVGNVLWYNPDLLAKYGVDASAITTYEDWLAALKKIKDAGGEGVVVGAKDQWPGGHYLNDLVQNALGSKATTALYNRSVLAGQPDTPKWTDPAVVNALKNYTLLKPYFQNGFLGEGADTAGAEFLAGKAAFYEMGSWFLNNIVSTPPKFKVGTMLFPAVNGGAGSGKEVTLAQEALIFAKNDDPAVVKAFMEFFTRPDTAGTFTAGRAVIPTYKTTGGTVPPVIAAQYKAVKGYVANAGANGSALFNDQGIAVDIYSKYIWQGSVGLMTGGVTPEKLAQQLEDATVAAQAANK